MASLSKVGSGKVPGRVIQFTDRDGQRRTIRLGKVGLVAAREFKCKVEALVSWSITNLRPDSQTSAWLGGLSDKMHAKLAALGLCEPRKPPPIAPTLTEWLDKYILQRTADLKPASVVSLENSAKHLRAHFGGDVRIDELTADGAHDWRAWLLGRSLSEATVRKQARNAKTIFRQAVKRKLIPENPFIELVSTSIAADRDRYVTPEETEQILDACPDVQWRVLFGLARLGGLRVPSETHILTWSAVDWDRSRLSVYAPKLERFEKHRRRSVPITPNLMRILQDAFDAAEDGQEHVVAVSRSNLHRELRAILKRAEIEPWEDAFQTLRRSCETEWAQHLPQHAVSSWMGHSEAVSRKHYLQITDDLFERAAALETGAAKSAAVSSRTESQSVASGENAKSTPPHETPCFVGSNAENGTIGGRAHAASFRTIGPNVSINSTVGHLPIQPRQDALGASDRILALLDYNTY